MAKSARSTSSTHALHVDRNKALDRWDVADAEGTVIGHGHEQSEAVALAIREAQHRHGRGDQAIVCVEQPDGHYTMAWSSR